MKKKTKTMSKLEKIRKELHDRGAVGFNCTIRNDVDVSVDSSTIVKEMLEHMTVMNKKLTEYTKTK